ncbi:hypothetical protein [Allostreptomyces psammosilenae]|uniref:Uncharacterized protein n=1 Tax=Allostreptomyces psammosilenae TaxID=1892865 RepID=A0A853A7N8_9ACTN|nr:hypothetical protein [Allostreptomyces psammosilenae]NYI06462.1 hypothetical protein [Allostreptomyces psammosilenae]
MERDPFGMPLVTIHRLLPVDAEEIARALRAGWPLRYSGDARQRPDT